MKYRLMWRGMGWVITVSLLWGVVLLVGMALADAGRPTLAAAPPPLVAPEVLRAWEAAPETPLRVIVILRTEENAQSALSAGRGTFVETLQQEYAAAKAPLDKLLAAAQARGEVREQRDLWIIHGLALTASPAFLQQLTAAPEVAEIRLDHYEQYLAPAEVRGAERTEATTLAWGVTQIRTPEVWQTLGISGTGAVVAIMDTGVEWQHPALLNNYRGNLGRGLSDHTGSWYDAVNDGVYPYDDHSHGTHVAGSAVGQNGIGVAPGARWIAVKMLAHEGYGYDSWIHAGFQWLLAPGGNPALAPDVINASWSSSQRLSTEFEEDIHALQAVGILPVFAAGNTGPDVGSVGSPASLPGVLAVGASDYDDEVAYFSGRGPSPWEEIKPMIVAPGINILSAIPGGIYAEYNGTSMGTPHVVGLVALLRSISPTLSITATMNALTTTAVPLSTTLPNNDSGWGRIDALGAALAVAHPGFIAGTVRSLNGGIPQATVTAATREAGKVAQVTADAQGRYTLALPAGQYIVTAAAFGYSSRTTVGLPVANDTLLSHDFILFALPEGTLTGRVQLASGAPPTRPIVIEIDNTPLMAAVNAAGTYRLTLPVGTYSVAARGLGYRVMTASVAIQTEQTTSQDFTLPPAPTLLLVDEGPWYYGSQSAYWEGDLQALRYTYDKISLKHVPAQTPLSATLRAYDIVLWSSPNGSPGLVSGGQALRQYLLDGGHVFLSGQDVAQFDLGTLASNVSYLSQQMGVAYRQDTADSWALQGTGPFAGLRITITGGAGANNQVSPDVVGVSDTEKAAVLWEYTAGGGGGVGASVCVPYRSLFFGFGYEAIAEADARRAVMERSLDWLMQPPLTQGLRLTRLSRMPQIGLSGETLTHTLHLQHIGYAGQPEPVRITGSGQHWPTTITPATAILSPCVNLTVTVVVTVPPALGMEARDTFVLTVTGLDSGERVTTTLQTKTPAPVLLVDDDRWHPMEVYYTAALQRQHIPFDLWSTMHGSDVIGDASPSDAMLQAYPLVLWFTGYDWHRPIETHETVRLLTYLENGGRFLLSSQDFLYMHNGDALSRQLGVLQWDESSPKSAMGVAEHPAGGLWGPVKLIYPFRNWADEVEPVFAATPVVRSATGQPLALAHNALAQGAGKTLFYAFPLEALPEDLRALTLERAVGWLSPLGETTWTVTPTAPLPGQIVHNHLVLSNDATMTMPVAFTHTLPASLTLLAAPPTATLVLSLPGGLRYDGVARQLSWSGMLGPGARHPLTWEVKGTGPTGAVIAPTATLALPEWQLHFTRETQLRLAGGDLASSHWISAPFSAIYAGRPVTLGFVLHNQGYGSTGPTRVQFWLMEGLAPLTATLPLSTGVALAGWQGVLEPGATQLLTMALYNWDQKAALLRIDALLETMPAGRWEQRLWLTPGWLYLPLTLRRF